MDSVQSGFLERLLQLKRIAGSGNRLAQRTGVAQSTIQRYENEKHRSEPTLTTLVKLARGMNVSLDWLATGQGEMSEVRKSGSAEPGLDFALFQIVIECIEEWSKGTPIAPARKAELIVRIYRFCASASEKPTRAKIIALVRAAA